MTVADPDAHQLYDAPARSDTAYVRFKHAEWRAYCEFCEVLLASDDQKAKLKTRLQKIRDEHLAFDCPGEVPVEKRTYFKGRVTKRERGLPVWP